MPTDTDPNKSKTDDDQPKGLTEEDVGRIVNSAITSHIKRLDIGGQIKSALGELDLSDTIKSQVEKHLPKPDPASKGKDEGGDKGKGTDPAVEARISELAEKLEKAEAAREAAERGRVELEQTHKRSAAKSAFRDAVAEKVRGDLLPVFVDHFADARGLLSIDDDGVPKLKVKKAPYKGAPEEDVSLPLEQAVPILLAQKDVHPFLPAPGGQQGDGGDQKRRGLAPLKPPTIPNGGEGGDVNKANAVVSQLTEMGIDPSSL